jgi:hypothetical protein
MKDLKDGFLAPILERVKSDHTLCLEIRKDYLNVYYRGGSLLELHKSGLRYKAIFNKKYFVNEDDRKRSHFPGYFEEEKDVIAWSSMVPVLKHAMDTHPSGKKMSEREAQQLVVRDNNFGPMSNQTDYYICDIEYNIGQKSGGKQFDLIAIHWPSNTSRQALRSESQSTFPEQQLVIIEMKYGDGALTDVSGIHSHIKDVNAYLEAPKNGVSENLKTLKNEMRQVFEQKRNLGLINCDCELESFSEEQPAFQLLIMNHNPKSTVLDNQLETRPDSPNIDLYISTVSEPDYGLYDQAILPLDEARDKFNALI